MSAVMLHKAPEGCPIIIGAGLAGLMAALHLAPHPVLVLSSAPLGENAASAWAQGGLAAAIAEDDSPELHLSDTLAAGDGIVDAATARRIIAAAPALVDELARLGAVFDRDAAGRIACGLEAGHSRRRIVHAKGDASGREILRAVIAAVRRTPSITVWENISAHKLLLRDGAIAGVLVAAPGEASGHILPTDRVIMATGGLGGLYQHSTNPSGALGQGLMLAARAGAALADLEFVQFHPTALDIGHDPMPLVSEAVRGEGATLIDETGCRFMAGQGRAELEPRDIVSRAVWARLQAGHRVFLDTRAAMGARFTQRFPGIAAVCRSAGINPDTQPLPIRPAAHYHMGGIAVDADGRSNVAGLWACGEAACTGLHGANRLASNSLLEAAITGRRVAENVSDTAARRTYPLADLRVQVQPDAAPVRAIMSRYAGVLRDAAGLRAAISQLQPLADASDAACLGMMMCVAMLRRQESRGGHARTDFPGANSDFQHRLTLTLAQARKLAWSVEPAAHTARQAPP